MNPVLVFVYNADADLFNALTDMAHKIFAPETYSCNLCAITHSHFGMRKEWKQFLSNLDLPFEFLHRDELKDRYGIDGVPLPAVFKKDSENLEVWIDADSINACRTIDDLEQIIMDKLS